MILENNRYKIQLEQGIITGFFDKTDDADINLADRSGRFGTACFTLHSEDIRNLPHDSFSPYADYTAAYDVREGSGEDFAAYRDTQHDISARYSLAEDGLCIHLQTDNAGISGFGVNLDLNYMSKKGGNYQNQLLPTSPYTSENGKFMYCIMTRPDGRFLVATAKTECDGWKIQYSPFSIGHFILNFQFLASFDKVYQGSGRKDICVNLQSAESLDAAYRIIQAAYDMPLCVPVLSGGFDGKGVIQIYGDADELLIQSPSGKCRTEKATAVLPLSEYGLHTVIPIKNQVHGLSTTLWNGENMPALFDRCCDSIRPPYHNDHNLCEGGCFLWAMLLNMRLNNHDRYAEKAKQELGIIMGKGEYIRRKTIVPHATERFGPYHICDSIRVQEQFFGVSILLEAYQYFGDKEYLEFAVSALYDLTENFMTDGMIDNGEDYTTVCAPVIAIVDTANILKALKDDRAGYFAQKAIEVAEFLCRRGYNFPTEGETNDLTDTEMEDGAISCTALSLLYVCQNLKYEQRYADFAEEILSFHAAWRIYTPDARMFGSSFRWWETIWEGDGEGPAICAGHAWTIWMAEALYYYGLLFKDDKALLASWNGYITNFAKARADGTMYSCYEADYIRGGGDPAIKEKMLQLIGEDHSIKHEIAHDYPKHRDSSLSRYAWVRAAETWYHTAAILNIDGKTIAINAKEIDGVWETAPNITQIYLGDNTENVVVKQDIKRI